MSEPCSGAQRGGGCGLGEERREQLFCMIQRAFATGEADGVDRDQQFAAVCRAAIVVVGRLLLDAEGLSEQGADHRGSGRTKLRGFAEAAPGICSNPITF